MIALGRDRILFQYILQRAVLFITLLCIIFMYSYIKKSQNYETGNSGNEQLSNVPSHNDPRMDFRLVMGKEGSDMVYGWSSNHRARRLFKGNVPHCCKKTPIVVDLLPGVPYNQQFTNCCKGGVVPAWGQDPNGALSAFQVSVGLAGTSNKTVKLPKNFTLLGPGPGYTCGPAQIVPSTVFLTPDKRRKTQALSKFL